MADFTFTTPFSGYTTAHLFADNAANLLCNRMVSYLSNLGKPENALLLTGSPAKMLQGAEKEEIKCIPFITFDTTVYTMFQNNISEFIQVLDSVYYQDRLQITTPVAKLELWMSPSPLVSETVEGLHLQAEATIPTNIL